MKQVKDNYQSELTKNDWTIKMKRYSINGRKFWYITEDAGFSWKQISQKQALDMIDANKGVILG